MAGAPKYFMYFPGNYRWSAGFINMMSSAPYGGSEIGELHKIVHLWAYRDHAEREERRQRLLADDRWREYVKKVRPMIVSQQNKILIPAAFSPPIEDGS